MSNRSYVLQKPLPDLSPGAIFNWSENNQCYYEVRWKGTYPKDIVENSPDWFLPEQPEPESKGKDVFTKDDVVGLLTACVSEVWGANSFDHAQYLYDKFLKRRNLFPEQSKQPLKPDTKEERIQIDGPFVDQKESVNSPNKVYVFFVRKQFDEVSENKLAEIKQAIESVLNNDNEHDRRINFWKDVNQSLIDKKYTQQQLDEAIQKVEVNAWNFAREKMIIDGKPTERQYRFLSYYDYEVYKKDSETLYQKSLQGNTNTKTSKHWT